MKSETFQDVVNDAIKKGEETMERIEKIRLKKPLLSQRIAAFLAGVDLNDK